MLQGIERQNSGRAPGHIGYASSYLNTSNITQTTVHLVTDKAIKESPQLTVIAKQQRRYDQSIGGRESVKSINSQSLCDVPEVVRLNDEDTPDDDVCEEEIKPKRKPTETKNADKKQPSKDDANKSLV